MTQVYRKHIHTIRYVNFKSHHHPRIKAGIVKCLAHGAKEVCHPSMQQPQLDHIQEVFQDNNYPKQLVRRCIKHQSHRQKSGEEVDGSEEDTQQANTKKILCLPTLRVWVRAYKGPANNSTSSLPSSPKEPSTNYCPKSRTQSLERRRGSVQGQLQLWQHLHWWNRTNSRCQVEETSESSEG